MADDAVRLAEVDDFTRAAAKRTSAAGVGSGKPRTMEPAAAADESWANINKDGHWNRLHSHAGATWSGVYYIQSDPATLARRYSGSLILKVRHLSNPYLIPI